MDGTNSTPQEGTMFANGIDPVRLVFGTGISKPETHVEGYYYFHLNEDE